MVFVLSNYGAIATAGNVAKGEKSAENRGLSVRLGGTAPALFSTQKDSAALLSLLTVLVCFALPMLCEGWVLHCSATTLPFALTYVVRVKTSFSLSSSSEIVRRK